MSEYPLNGNLKEVGSTPTYAPVQTTRQREPGTSVNAHKPVVEPKYHNLDPLAGLLGHANEAAVVVEGLEMMPLVDTGSQISALTERSCTEIRLRILPLGHLLGGCWILRGWD